jgi:2-dehydropantoate 2-reductase
VKTPVSHTPLQKPLIHVVGAGAIGLLFAAKLSAIADIHMVSRTGRTDAFSFRMDEVTGTYRDISLAKEADASTEIRWLLVCTKSYDVGPAIKNLSDRMGEQTTIVLFSNGMGYQNAVAAAHPDCKLLIASTTEGANRLSNRQVRHAGKGLTTIGEYRLKEQISQSPDVQQDLQNLLAWLSRAGFACTCVEDIKPVLWKKLIINCGINPFTAILDCRNGEILSHPFFQSRITGLSRELAGAAAANGISVTANECEAMIKAVAMSTALNLSSMLQDIRRRKRTEIDFINGFIGSIEQKQEQEQEQEQEQTNATQYPLNRELVRLVRALESAP